MTTNKLLFRPSKNFQLREEVEIQTLMNSYIRSVFQPLFGTYNILSGLSLEILDFNILSDNTDGYGEGVCPGSFNPVKLTKGQVALTLPSGDYEVIDIQESLIDIPLGIVTKVGLVFYYTDLDSNALNEPSLSYISQSLGASRKIINYKVVVNEDSYPIALCYKACFPLILYTSYYRDNSLSKCLNNYTPQLIANEVSKYFDEESDNIIISGLELSFYPGIGDQNENQQNYDYSQQLNRFSISPGVAYIQGKRIEVKTPIIGNISAGNSIPGLFPTNNEVDYSIGLDLDLNLILAPYGTLPSSNLLVGHVLQQAKEDTCKFTINWFPDTSQYSLTAANYVFRDATTNQVVQTLGPITFPSNVVVTSLSPGMTLSLSVIGIQNTINFKYALVASDLLLTVPPSGTINYNGMQPVSKPKYDYQLIKWGDSPTNLTQSVALDPNTSTFTAAQTPTYSPVYYEVSAATHFTDNYSEVQTDTSPQVHRIDILMTGSWTCSDGQTINPPSSTTTLTITCDPVSPPPSPVSWRSFRTIDPAIDEATVEDDDLIAKYTYVQTINFNHITSNFGIRFEIRSFHTPLANVVASDPKSDPNTYRPEFFRCAKQGGNYYFDTANSLLGRPALVFNPIIQVYTLKANNPAVWTRVTPGLGPLGGGTAFNPQQDHEKGWGMVFYSFPAHTPIYVADSGHNLITAT